MIPSHLLTLIPQELRLEREHVIKTRLGILIQGSERPTPQQLAIAMKEANDWENRYHRERTIKSNS